jgi:hypothetical protein
MAPLEIYIVPLLCIHYGEAQDEETASKLSSTGIRLLED